MEKDIAKMLLESILDRIVTDPKTGQKSLPGILSKIELEALQKALEELGGSPLKTIFSLDLQTLGSPNNGNEATNLKIEDSIDKEEPSASPTVVSETSQIVAELNLASLNFNEAENKEVNLCLDFGTAMSKAFATIVENDEVIENLPLKIGKRDTTRAGVIYPIPSSIWIENSGRIFFGDQAIANSLLDISGKRHRFDSLKRELTMGLPQTSLHSIQLDKQINPTDTPFSMDDAITLYLGYLTDLTCTELSEQYGKSRYVRRRFALPSWPPDRKDWGVELLKKMLSKAQIVADTFHGRWVDGITIKEAKMVLDNVNVLPNFPEYLIGEGITEPLAAGASQIRKEEASRGIVMVIDIGAGTSDMALFVAVENPNKSIFNAWPVKNCTGSLSMAGDALDQALLAVIREKEHIDTSDPNFQKIFAQLRMDIRRLKEDLFNNGNCTYTLVSGSRGTIDLDDFLDRDEVTNFSTRLFETFDEILNKVDKSIPERLHVNGLTVVLTGGGANLPMVKKLAKGKTSIAGININRDQAPLVPEAFLSDSELSYVYPQLAVAIGGAMPVLMNEANTIETMPGIAGPAPTISTYQISGL
jgi:hypothetical protein